MGMFQKEVIALKKQTNPFDFFFFFFCEHAEHSPEAANCGASDSSCPVMLAAVSPGLFFLWLLHLQFSLWQV